MSDQVQASNVPQQWRVEDNYNKSFTVDCINCDKRYDYNSTLFHKDASLHNPEILKTDQVAFVNRNNHGVIMPMIIAIATYTSIHRAFNEVGTPIMEGVWVPLLAAVFTYSVSKLLFFRKPKDVPVYLIKCSQCQSDLYFAAAKRKFGLPVYAPREADSTAVEGGNIREPKKLDAPCKVFITRPYNMTGAVISVDVLLNNVDIGKLKNGTTISSTTSYVVNEITIVHSADNATRTIRFKAKSGGSVRIKYNYVGGELEMADTQVSLSETGLSAAQEYLARAKEDHVFKMRTQKCINEAEHVQLGKTEGYIFTEDEFVEAKMLVQ